MAERYDTMYSVEIQKIQSMEIMVKDVAVIYCAIKKHQLMKKQSSLLLLKNTGENDKAKKKVQLISYIEAERS